MTRVGSGDVDEPVVDVDVEPIVGGDPVPVEGRGVVVDEGTVGALVPGFVFGSGGNPASLPIT